MKIYTLHRKQLLSTSIDQAWDFFSNADNLTSITPAYMRFCIIQRSNGPAIHEGQIIQYKLYPFPYLPVSWTTEITSVQKPEYFVDEQRSGPYSLWRHRHYFRPVAGGVEMTDEVHYAIPFGFIGRIANWLFVRRQLNTIFDYRFAVLGRIFDNDQLLKTA